MSNNRILGQKKSLGPISTCENCRCYGDINVGPRMGNATTGSTRKADHDPVSARRSHCRVSERRWSKEMCSQGCRCCDFCRVTEQGDVSIQFRWWGWGELLPDSPRPGREGLCSPAPWSRSGPAVFRLFSEAPKNKTSTVVLLVWKQPAWLLCSACLSQWLTSVCNSNKATETHTNEARASTEMQEAIVAV